jgi:hypothetical protein
LPHQITKTSLGAGGRPLHCLSASPSGGPASSLVIFKLVSRRAIKLKNVVEPFSMVRAQIDDERIVYPCIRQRPITRERTDSLSMIGSATLQNLRRSLSAVFSERKELRCRVGLRATSRPTRNPSSAPRTYLHPGRIYQRRPAGASHSHHRGSSREESLEDAR